MIERTFPLIEAKEILREFPVLGIIGPRQIGKTTLAASLRDLIDGASIYLDLESDEDAEILNNAEFFFRSNEDKCIIIDEVQRNKKLFPLLRSVIDRNRRNGRFILLGSASPDLIRDSSESLAGRIAYLELTGLNLLEFKIQNELWLKGGYPIIHTQKPGRKRWFTNYVNTYIEKDLPLLGLTGQSTLVKRLTYMIGNLTGELLNYSTLSKSLELTVPTVKKYIEIMEGAFLIRRLMPFSMNAKKRLVKSPKIYFRDSGILNSLLNFTEVDQLMLYPKVGNLWESFVVEQIAQRAAGNLDLFFYRTSNGAETDLVLVNGITPVAVIEIKYGSQNSPSKGNIISANDLKAKHKFLVHSNTEAFTWKNNNGWTICSLQDFLENQLQSLI